MHSYSKLTFCLLIALGAGCTTTADEPTPPKSEPDDSEAVDEGSTDGSDDATDDDDDGKQTPRKDGGSSLLDAGRADAGRIDAGRADAGRTELPDASPRPDATIPTSPDAGAATYDWVAGDYPPNINSTNYLTITGVAGQKGKTRGYKVHVPKGYDPKVPAPVLFSFHGYQQNALMFTVSGTSFVKKSDEKGFILVIPNGNQEDGIGGSWNGGVCCGSSAQQKLDDVALVRAIYADVKKHVNVDERRVYATGLSNGGFFTHRLGCEAADLFVAIAPLAGSIGTKELGAIGTNADPDLKECKPSKPIAVLAMHGNGDPIVPYAGMKPSLDLFAAANGCSTTTVAAKQPASGGDTTCVTYEGCKGGVEVTGCTVEKGGHCWFGDASCGTGAPGIGNLFVGNNSTFLNATDAAWEFVSRFSR